MVGQNQLNVHIQTKTWIKVKIRIVMSALPPKADIRVTTGTSARKRTFRHSFDHLIGAVEQRGRDCEPDEFGGL